MTPPSFPESVSGNDPLAPEPPKTAAGENSGDKIPRSRGAEILIFLIGSGLLVLTSFIVVNFFTARSRDAVINATPIAIRTPITGTLQSLPVKTGEAVELNQELAVIRNTSASREELEQISTEHLAARSRQADLRRQVQAQRKLVAAIEGDAGRQQELEQRRNRHDLGQTMADLQRARGELAFAERESRRLESLFRSGAVAANVYDRALTTKEQRRRELEGLEARLASNRTDLEAANLNLVLRNNRSGSDPVVRLQEASRTLQDLQGDLRTQDERVAGLERQLAAANQQWEKRNQSVLRSPRHAVVWELQAQAGDLL